MTLVPGLVPWMEASGHSQLLPKYTVSPCEAVWDQVWFAAPLQSQICVRPPASAPVPGRHARRSGIRAGEGGQSAMSSWGTALGCREPSAFRVSRSTEKYP